VHNVGYVVIASRRPTEAEGAEHDCQK
jgi:hypothetical protein